MDKLSDMGVSSEELDNITEDKLNTLLSQLPETSNKNVPLQVIAYRSEESKANFYATINTPNKITNSTIYDEDGNVVDKEGKAQLQKKIKTISEKPEGNDPVYRMDGGIISGLRGQSYPEGTQVITDDSDPEKIKNYYLLPTDINSTQHFEDRIKYAKENGYTAWHGNNGKFIQLQRFDTGKKDSSGNPIKDIRMYVNGVPTKN